MVNNIPVNGWPQLKDLEAVQPTLDRLDKIEAWKRTVKEETFTGSELTIENALALPARSLKTVINAIQDLHGYDHPWVGGADINYLDLKARFPDNAKSVTSDGITYTRVDDTDGNPLGVQASNTATGYSYCDVQLTLEAGRYKSAVTGIEANKMSLNLREGTNREYFKAANEEFTLTEQTLIWVRFTVNQGDSANNTIKCMIYKYDGTDKTFRPYSNICPISGRDSVVLTRSDGDEISEDFTIQLGQTVYGAEINWDTGVMTVKTAFKQYNGDASEEWSYNSVYGFMMVTPPTDADNIKENGIYAISNAYKRMETPSVTTMADGEFFINSSALSLRTRYGAFKNTAFTDVTAWKAYLANNPLQIEYELANKPTIQLTPTQLEMLKGYNHITLSDGYGTIELKALTGANWS